MECKVSSLSLRFGSTQPIRIYPEWNVKSIESFLISSIYTLEYIQNGM